MTMKVSVDSLRPVGWESIPDHDDGVANMTRQPLQEGDHRLGVHVHICTHGKVKSYLPPLRRNRKNGNDRDFLLGPGPLVQDRRLTPGGPTAPNQGSHQQPGFVDEDQGGLQARRVFFIRGQSFLTQPRMACSSRSRARRSGFCGVQPIERNRRPMWSTW